jgi:hypothetical protein
MGSLVKRLLAPLLGCGEDPRRLYHATVMPCYDKKLEAAREELTLPDGEVPEASARVLPIHSLLISSRPLRGR